jgi:glycosyltransferase involved in cell wall biosynthesis
MKPEPSKPVVVVLNNEIVPYRIPLFNSLADDPDLRFSVLYSTHRGWDRQWTLDRKRLHIPHRVLPGLAVRLRKPDYGEYRTVYLNPTLLWHLIRLRPHVVVGYEYSIPAMTALLYSRMSGCAYVVWTEGTRHTERHLTHGQRWTRRMIIPRAQAYLGTSLAACANLIQAGAPPDRVHEAPQTHAVRWFGQAAEKARATTPTRSARQILYVGFLNERKGVIDLLQAFAAVAEGDPGVRLIFVGEGPLQPRLETLATELGIRARVEWRGFVQPEDMPSVYAAADIFVLPSQEDTFGVVVVEALASRVPVICSRNAGVASHLEDEQTALLMDAGDVGQLAERITRLLTQPELSERLVSAGHRVAKAFEARSVALPFKAAVQTAMEIRRR